MHIRLRTSVALIVACSFMPFPAVSQSVVQPRAQTFVITAYYSPRPNQCCYITGSYDSDRVLNGQGTHGASGVPVHPGMAAAPSSYPFGTRIELPGIGVVTVEDRGGAILTGSGSDRLDLWMGEGEEGLARAVAFGQQRIIGTVYPSGSNQPAEGLRLESMTAPSEIVTPYAAQSIDLLTIRPQKGDRGLSVTLLQRTLSELGFFERAASGFYGDETATALKDFITSFGLRETSDAVTDITASALTAAYERRKAPPPVATTVLKGADPSAVRAAQRTLRMLGYYEGRTSGIYDDALFDAVFAFQKASNILGSESDVGAGVLGPRTRAALTQSWNVALVKERSSQLLVIARVRSLVASKGYGMMPFLSKGDQGSEVRRLQELLVERGFLGADRVTGFFGNETELALRAFQLHEGIIRTVAEKGSGFFGPETRRRLAEQEGERLYELVKSNGWKSIL